MQAEIETQLPLLQRATFARASIDDNARIILVPDLKTGCDIANAIAPEHLELCVDEPFAWLPLVQNAASVFLGRYCPETLGDYIAGPNHTLPTSGAARFASPLGVDDFIKRSSYLYYTRDALLNAGADAQRFANSEGLTAHASAVSIRTEEQRMSRLFGRPPASPGAVRAGRAAAGSAYVKLNTNESPFPPSPRVVEALNRQIISQLNLYPDPLAKTLCEAIARNTAA